MSKQNLASLLDGLIADWESEVVEFKRANDNFSTGDIGKYFSALANEANLRNVERAWLVFGIDNQSRQIVGTDYRQEHDRLHKLKLEILRGSEPSISVREIHELLTSQGRVLMFEIPAAPFGMPIAWNGHYYARAGESLTHLGLDKQDEMRKQVSDWSAQIVKNATLADLDEQALAKARESFVKKYANRFGADEVMRWSDSAFLDRAKLTQGGQITRTTLLLLGKAESAYLLSPHPVQMTWKLEGAERAYQHFGAPFLLNTTALYQKIRNIQLRILPDDQLIPIELPKYDQKIVLEALHNCIAHQDYTRNARIIVTEHPDQLIFENEGMFFEGQPTDYCMGEKSPRRYRNPFLMQAMVELNLVDQMGYGIFDMYRGQAKRYFPMPDYDLREPLAVKMTLYGSIVDPAFSRILIQVTDLSLHEIIALDRIQKKLPVDDAMVQRLRRAKLIEGHKPNLHVSASIAATTETKADYIRTRAQDDEFYAKLLMDYLAKYQQATRKEIEVLLLSKLSEALTREQKMTKLTNLLTKMRANNMISNIASNKKSLWTIADKKVNAMKKK
ncbi:MAG: putative DNA binding domain-containing protein [Gallionella sp.]|nr:putative DNA binding domain-containing protein [Gallionella sp.]